MENTNADAQFDVVEQEDVTSGDLNNFDSDIHDDEVVTISKSKLNGLRRKAIAYETIKEKPQQTTTINKSSDDAWKQKMELKVEGYNDEEVDLIMKNGGKAALEDKYIKTAIEAVRTQKAAESAMLGNEGGKSSPGSGFSPNEFAKLSAEEQLKQLSNLS